MKKQKSFSGLIAGAGCLIIGLYLGAIIAVIWVVIHFILKFW